MAQNNRTIALSSGDVLSLSRMQGDFYLDAAVDIQALNKIINGAILRPRYRIFSLHQDESVDYQIPNEDILSGGSYSENYQDGQRRSLSFSLYNQNGQYTPSINTIWSNTKFALDLGIELDDGSIVWSRKGIYVVTSLAPTRSTDKTILSVEAADKFSIFEGKLGTLEVSYEIPTQTDIQSLVAGILLGAKGNGFALDPIPPFFHSSFKGKKTQAKISKSAGETLGSVLQDIATQLSAEMFYNARGQLCFLPIQETTTDVNKPVLASLISDEGDIDSLGFTLDMKEIVNRVVVIGATVNGAIYDSTAVNDDPSSPLCYQRVGYRTAPVINDSNIASQDLADDRAKYELRKFLILKSSTSLNISFNPLLSVNNLITISDDFFVLEKERFLLQSISCSLDYSGTMSISVSNVKNLPFTAR